MKIIKSAALCVLLGSSILSTAANSAVTLISAVPDADPAGLTDANLATAQAQCDAAAAALDTDGSSPQSDLYFGTVVQGTPTFVSGPTEVGTEDDRTLTSEREGAGTFTPAHREIEGDPIRNGGSVNMFGNQIAVGGHYSNSAYDFTADFDTVYNVAYTCDITMQNYIPAHTVHHNAEGVYVVYGDFGDSEDAIRANCEAFTAAGLQDPQPEWFGDEFHGGNVDPTSNGFGPHCQFQGTQASDEDVAEDWEDEVFVSNVPGGSFDQTQTDNLAAHESLGTGFDTEETLNIGKVVVCISPKKLPGIWTKQNGYTGSLCTTAWYNSGAMTGVTNLNTGSHNWVTVPVI